MSYESFSSELSQRMIGQTDKLKTECLSQPFCVGLKSMDDVDKIFDRKEEIGKLRGVKGDAQASAGKWVAIRSHLEVMAGCARDVESRYGTRLWSYVEGGDAPHALKMSLKLHESDTQAIAKK